MYNLGGGVFVTEALLNRYCKVLFLLPSQKTQMTMLSSETVQSFMKEVLVHI